MIDWKLANDVMQRRHALGQLPGARRHLGSMVSEILADEDERAGKGKADKWPGFIAALRERHPAPSLPKPLSAEPPPKPHTETETEEAA